MEINFKLFYVSVFVFMLFMQVNSLDRNFYKLTPSHSFKVLSDLPTKKDLPIYLTSLHSLINYISKNKKCMDFGMKFGLFILNANIKPFVHDRSLSQSMRINLADILKKSDKSQMVFDKKLEKLKINQPLYYELTKMYVSMLTNDTAWSHKILKLNLDLLKGIYSYNHKFPEWDKYVIDMDNMIKWMPDPDLANTCLSALSINEETHEQDVQCHLGEHCVEMLDYGNNVGYMLTFKLLYLLLARNSRGCMVFLNLQDEHVRHHLCKNAFREAEYIARNDFKKMDLLVEEISLCTLDGHAQFLRRSWISRFLQHQTPYGYFTENILTPERKQLIEQEIKDGLKDDENDTCREHINAVVVGALAAAIRYILESFY